MGLSIPDRLYLSRNCRLASYLVILCLELESGNYEVLLTDYGGESQVNRPSKRSWRVPPMPDSNSSAHFSRRA